MQGVQESVLRLGAYTEIINYLGHTVSVRPRPPLADADGNSGAAGAGPPVGPLPSWRLEEPRAGAGVVLYRAPLEKLHVAGTILDAVRVSPGKDRASGGARTSPLSVVSAAPLPEEKYWASPRKLVEPVGCSSEGNRGEADSVVEGSAIPKRSPTPELGAAVGDTVWVAAPSEEAPEILTRSSSERRGVSAPGCASPLRPSSLAGKLSARSSAGGVGAAQVEIRSAEADPEWDSLSVPGVPSGAT